LVTSGLLLEPLAYWNHTFHFAFIDHSFQLFQVVMPRGNLNSHEGHFTTPENLNSPPARRARSTHTDEHRLRGLLIEHDLALWLRYADWGYGLCGKRP